MRLGAVDRFIKDLAVVPATAMLLRAHFDRLAGRVASAKVRVQKIQAKYPGVFDFLDAFHGFLLISEGDIETALKHFRANMEMLPSEKNDDQRYIELYCRYFLEAGEQNFDWESIILEADRLKPDAFTKKMLVLPTKEQMISALIT